MVKMRDIPCQKCGWKFPGFHVCVLDFDTAEGLAMATKVESPVTKKRSNRQHQADDRSPEHRQRISDGVKARYARDPKRIERNAEIIRLYTDEELDLSMRETAVRVGVDFRTVANVLHAAADAGEVVIRRVRPRRVGG